MQKNTCAKCGKPASVKFTRIVSGQVIDIFLCADHAAEESPYQKPKLPLSNILEGLLKQNFEITGGTAPSQPGLRCHACGLGYDAYKKNLMLGCSECYASFHDQLIPDLRKLHGEIRHTGRCPGGGQAQPVTPSFSHLELADESAAPIDANSPSMGGGALLKDPRQAMSELHRALRDAIADEDYKRAAVLRDQIHELRQMTSGPQEPPL